MPVVRGKNSMMVRSSSFHVWVVDVSRVVVMVAVVRSRLTIDLQTVRRRHTVFLVGGHTHTTFDDIFVPSHSKKTRKIHRPRMLVVVGWDPKERGKKRLVVVVVTETCQVRLHTKASLQEKDQEEEEEEMAEQDLVPHAIRRRRQERQYGTVYY